MPELSDITPTWITPDWPAPENVKGVSTTRAGGVSDVPFASLNLGDHVADDHRAVEQNRQILRETLQLSAEPLWLEQVHGTDVFCPTASDTISKNDSGVPIADASAVFDSCLLYTSPSPRDS